MLNKTKNWEVPLTHRGINLFPEVIHIQYVIMLVYSIFSLMLCHCCCLKLFSKLWHVKYYFHGDGDYNYALLSGKYYLGH